MTTWTDCKRKVADGRDPQRTNFNIQSQRSDYLHTVTLINRHQFQLLCTKKTYLQ